MSQPPGSPILSNEIAIFNEGALQNLEAGSASLTQRATCAGRALKTERAIRVVQSPSGESGAGIAVFSQAGFEFWPYREHCNGAVKAWTGLGWKPPNYYPFCLLPNCF